MVKIFNPKKKSEFIVRMWHDVDEAFKSTTALKLQLKDSFETDLPSNTSFAVGYFEGKSHVKRWIVDNRDLERMYSILEPRSTINLWCEGKSTSRDSRNSRTRDAGEEPTVEEPPAKKTKATKHDQIEEVESIVTKLKDKHPQMPTPKIRLWAKLIHTGRYEDMDTPPDIPLITGAPASAKPKKDNSIAEALTGAATAVVKMLQGNAQSPKMSEHDTSLTTTTISPMKLAHLRRSCLEDLKRVKDLHDDGVLTDREYADEKERILESLRGLK